jgi:uncharacterized protein
MFERLRRTLHALAGRSDEELIDLLTRQLDAALEGARLVRQTVLDHPPRQARQEIARIEHAGDDARAELVEALAAALVTPIDREDLFRVSRSADNVLDNLQDFVREFDLFAIGHDERFVPLIDAVITGVDVLRDAVRSIVDKPSAVSTGALAATKQVNEVRRLYQGQLADLFEGEVSSGVLKRRELLRRLDVVALRLGEAADALADGALKRGY